uniref:BppU N-terminal domain-containing protein n=1 Tax=viral metagenome TaxID=1070528 RepID=A0A6M3JN83_9ZZZZ
MTKIVKVIIDKDTQLILGSAIEITVMLSADKPTSVTITIEDSGLVKKVTSANMDRVNSKVYRYIYQSDSSHDYGTYTAKITLVDGGYTTYREKTFDLIDQTD